MSALLAQTKLIQLPVLVLRYPRELLAPSDPGAITSMSLMYLHAVFGLFQYALCMMVDRESPAKARDTAPPERKECRENSCVSSAAIAYCLSALDIVAVVTGKLPLNASPCAPSEASAKRYPDVISQPTCVPTATNCSVARTGQMETYSSSYLSLIHI